MDSAKKLSESQPFQMMWLDSCYQQTLLPDAPWHKLETKIANSLTKRVEKQFANTQRKEALLQLLGEEFLKTYFPEVDRNPQILEPPAMSVNEKQRLMREAHGYLKAQMSQVVKEIGYQSLLTGTSQGDSPHPDYADFCEHTFHIFRKGLDRELFHQEEELMKKKNKEIDKKRAHEKLNRIPVPSRVKPILTDSTATLSQPSSGVVREMVHKIAGDPPPLWGAQSDTVGKAVLSILQRDPKKFEMVVGRLHGRQLPGSLRAYIWADILMKAERKKMKDINVEKVVRERFARAVARGISELGLTRATHSPISGLIETAVIETYGKNTSLVAFKTDDHMKEAIRTLNILYVYDRSYEPYLIHWLFPLQLAFQSPSENTTEKGQLVMELAMYLDLLNSTCFPNWPHVFAVADQSMKTVSQGDPELYHHLKNISTKNVKVKKKEFLVQLIHGEKIKAKSLLQETADDSDEEDISEALIADPVIFMRRWIGEGFVSVLDSPGVMYVWDQCFMQGWNLSVLKNFCLAILELLRHKFMECTDYMDMKEVFLFEPCKLYTVDIQMAWIHMENAKPLMELHYYNRQRPVTPISRMSSIRASAMSQISETDYIFGIKNIKMKLDIPSEAVNREPWIENVDADNLRLKMAVYFGSILLKSSELDDATGLSSDKDSYGNTEYVVSFSDKIELDLDFTPYDLERELGAYPYGIITVVYEIPGPSEEDTISKPVGWARIPLFHRSLSGSSVDASWTLQSGDSTYALHPGDFPETLVAAVPKTPLQTTDQRKANILGYNSKVTVVVYDPRNEPLERNEESPPIPSIPSIPKLAEGSPVSVAPMDTRHNPIPKPAKPMASVQEDNSPWIKHSTAAAASNPKPTGVDEPFDLYVDGVRFIPHCASIIKVTGRLFQTGEAENSSDIMALPMLDSSARSPSFKYRLTINKERKKSNPGLMILLHIYTKDFILEDINVIGSCCVVPFDSQKGNKLRVGGHQYRLHNGLPVFKDNNFKSTDMEFFPIVPSTSILVRILPHTDQFVDAPKYSTGYYQSSSCQPNISELRIFESCSDNTKYPKTVREMIQQMQLNEGAKEDKNDQKLLKWLEDELPNVSARNMTLSTCVHYRIKRGLNIKFNQAYGLPEALYIQCFASIEPGAKIENMDSTPEGYGGEEKFITAKHDFDSFQHAPIWLDDAKELHPFYDDNSCLVVQLFGLDLLYRPKPDHNEPGTVHTLQGLDLDLADNQIIGWTVLPLFSGMAVLTGVHEVPLFKGKPPSDMLDEFTKQHAFSVLKEHVWNNNSKFPAGSLTITMWDGHFEYEELPEIPIHQSLLEAVGSVSEYNKAKNPTKGKKISNFIVDNLETKFKKQGTASSIYKKEQKWFEELIVRTFYDLMENVLMTAGMGPM